MIRLRKVAVVFAGRPALEDIDLDLAPGTVTLVVGASGSGKTTLLRVVAGLAVPTSGSITLDGAPAPFPRGVVSLAMQEDPVYERMDVDGNLGFPLDVAHIDAPKRDERVAEVASVMGLRRMLRRRPRTLSGGERAAVAVGRALAAPAASYVMFDEPLAKADTRRREAFVARVREVRRSRPETGFVIASNDPTPLLTVADTVVILDGGRAIQVDSPEEVWDRPVSVRVVAVLGDPAMNLFPARVRHRGAELVADIGARQVVLDRRLEIGEGHTVLVGIHAAELSVAAPGTPFDRALAVTVGSVEASRGVVRFGLGSTPAAVFAMRHPDALSVRAGDRLELTWTTGRVRIFDAESGRTIPGEPPGAPGSGPAG